MVEYIGIAGGAAGDGGGPDFDFEAWAPYIGGGFIAVLVLAWLFLKK